jgi:hypothetical protein
MVETAAAVAHRCPRRPPGPILPYFRFTFVERAKMDFRALRTSIAVLSAALATACGGSASTPTQPAGSPPSPSTVSVDEPGGDAEDPHYSALMRLATAPWGRRNDKDDQVHAPTPDWEYWKRVRYFGFDHFTGFRYGEDHHVVAVVLVQDVPPGAPTDSQSCLRRFEDWARPQARNYDVKFRGFAAKQSEWQKQPIIVKYVDGAVALGFSYTEFSAAWTAYPAYPDACLIYAVAVPWREHAELAQKVRDRWVNEGFPQMIPLTKTRPYRK